MFKLLKQLFMPEPLRLYWYSPPEKYGNDWVLGTNYGRFRGDSTEWGLVPDCKEPSTGMILQLCNLYKRCRWDVQDFKDTDAERRSGYCYKPGEAGPVGRLESYSFVPMGGDDASGQSSSTADGIPGID